MAISSGSERHFLSAGSFLPSIKEKLFYVLVGIVSYGSGWDSEDSNKDEVYERMKADFPELTRDDFESALGGNVDHQSLGTIDAAMARDPRVGNDNGDDSRERQEAIGSGEVDWGITEFDRWSDEEYISEKDKKELQAFGKL